VAAPIVSTGSVRAGLLVVALVVLAEVGVGAVKALLVVDAVVVVLEPAPAAGQLPGVVEDGAVVEPAGVVVELLELELDDVVEPDWAQPGATPSPIPCT
jgi:hypothetical protein